MEDDASDEGSHMYQDLAENESTGRKFRFREISGQQAAYQANWYSASASVPVFQDSIRVSAITKVTEQARRAMRMSGVGKALEAYASEYAAQIGALTQSLAVMPNTVLISAGIGNQYGHPDPAGDLIANAAEYSLIDLDRRKLEMGGKAVDVNRTDKIRNGVVVGQRLG